MVEGKFFFLNGQKLYVKGVTYGPFRADRLGNEHGPARRVSQDFARMAVAGVNAVRLYTVPQPWMLDTAAEHGLRVLVGVPWEQHITFLDDARRAADIEQRIFDAVRGCANHPAILGYAIGNEIPAPIVRWYGNHRVEKFIHRLYCAAKSADPIAPVTYVNYPSTEYLDLPFLDFTCFNVYLESPDALQAYLARLQNIAGDRPLLMGEIGLCSLRNGELGQARALRWQLETSFASGLAGAFIFSWTDEWHRGGEDIEGWSFGLTTRQRNQKPALDAVRQAFAQLPFRRETSWPRISVIVCTCNGSATIGGCLEGLSRLRYPDYEVIVVDDGSSDGTASIVKQFMSERGDAMRLRLIEVANGGLSRARNIGLDAATGQIVAYLDDDAWPDEDWLSYLAQTFRTTSHVGVGGPNIPPRDDGFVARCVARSPGGPIHVLLTDTAAEHIPGCNMSFRADALRAAGGFDPQFRIAGDDVDICWRLQERGGTLGFNPAAVVWHRRRSSVRAYWKQQVNYGRAESDLERKWPQKYNAIGHLSWCGRLYANHLPASATWWSRRRIYHGTWGSALFQSVYHERPSLLASLPVMPEWYLLVLLTAMVSVFGVLWRPLLWALPLLSLIASPPLITAAFAAARSLAADPDRPGRRIRAWLLTTSLHVLQPMARLWGRVSAGLTPWRRRSTRGWSLPCPRRMTLWSERWQATQQRLCSIEQGLLETGTAPIRGNDFARWDLHVRGGMIGAARVVLLSEEHGGGQQLVRMRVSPCLAAAMWTCVATIFAIAMVAWFAHRPTTSMLCAAAGATLMLRGLYDCGAAIASVIRVARQHGWEPQTDTASAPGLPPRRLPLAHQPSSTCEHRDSELDLLQGVSS
jgi:GT2 family glycosyltransferase